MAHLCAYAQPSLHLHLGELHDTHCAERWWHTRHRAGRSADSLCSDSDWLFCYRWLLLEFKREFPLEDVCGLWEVGPVHWTEAVSIATCTKVEGRQ